MTLTSWEYDFLAMAASLFELLVLTLLPTTALVIFLVYLKRIITVYMETRRAKAKAKRKAQAENYRISGSVNVSRGTK